MDIIVTIIAVILGIVFSVALHELGHLIPAKLFGVPAPEYFIGFGKKLWSFKRGETEYGIKPILAGGYTRIEGMFPPAAPGHKDRYFANLISEAREESAKGLQGFDKSRAFYNLSTPKKLAVMMGGTLTNCVLGFICFFLAFSVIGGASAVTTLAAVSEGMPAAAAGIQAGDQILAVDGSPVETWADVQSKIRGSQGADVEIDIRRGGETISKDVEVTENAGIRVIGITPATEPKRISPVQSLEITRDTITGTVVAIASIPSGMVDALRSLATNTERENKSLISVVGIGQAAVSQEEATDSIWLKIAGVLSLLGSLNIALFVFNLIPLLPLDGGHSANAIYEGIKRLVFRVRRKPRPAPSDLAQTMPIAYLIYGFLMLMFVIMVLADVFHPIF